MSRHRHQKWIKFLKHVDEATDPEVDLHLVADDYATHKHPRVRHWLERHPRFHMHFIPTSSSWLNLIERWFREVCQADCISRDTLYRFSRAAHSGRCGAAGVGAMEPAAPARPPRRTAMRRHIERPCPPPGRAIRLARSA
jgi:hypothetical protein